MEILLARKGIHFFMETDDEGNLINYAFTDKMLDNNVIIEFAETSAIVNQSDPEENHKHDDDDEGDTIQETRLSVQAIIGKQGMDYTIFYQPDVVVSRMILYSIILNLVEILENVPPPQYNAYLTAAATGCFSSKELRGANPELNLTAEIQEKITKLRKLLKQRRAEKN